MGLKIIAAILLIFLTLLVTFKSYFLWLLLICVGLFLLIVFIRLLADLYWWGRKKGKWR